MNLSATNHMLFGRLAAGQSLVEGLQALLRQAGVATGLVHAHGVIEDVELRTFSPETHALGVARRLVGAVHLLSSEGTIGMSEGAPHVVLRAILSRETDAGVETLSGVVTQARVVALEVTVLSAQELAMPLAFEPRAGLMMLTATPEAPARERPAAEPAWAETVAVSNAQPALKPAPTQASLPARPPPRPTADDDAAEPVFPEAGDEVQHFAFGKCEVVRSDGDRLHLKVGKDGRIREIALEMLKVVLLDPDPSVRPRHFRLDRRL